MNFFPSDFLVKESLPALKKGAWNGFGVDFEFFCRSGKGEKILFFCVIIPQNANCRKNWFFPWFQPLNFHFAFWRLNNSRSFFPQNFRNGIWRNSKFQCEICLGRGFDVCSAGNKVCFLNCDDSFPVKGKYAVMFSDFPIYELLRDTKFFRHFSFRLERPCNNHFGKGFQKPHFAGGKKNNHKMNFLKKMNLPKDFFPNQNGFGGF